MNRIKQCREKSNLSQKYVAVALGVAAPSVSNWESGKTKPSLDNYVNLARLFGVSVEYLLGVTDKDENEEKTPTAISDGSNREYQEIFTLLNSWNRQRALDFAKGLLTAQGEDPSGEDSVY